MSLHGYVLIKQDILYTLSEQFVFVSMFTLVIGLGLEHNRKYFATERPPTAHFILGVLSCPGWSVTRGSFGLALLSFPATEDYRPALPALPVVLLHILPGISSRSLVTAWVISHRNNRSCSAVLEPVVHCGLWMESLLVRHFTTLSMDKFDESGVLFYVKFPNVNTLHCTIFKNHIH